MRSLQLGHAGEGVEILPLVSHAEFGRLLQLGHAGEGVEISIAANAEFVKFSASIGPRR